jgi:hypothetical protein
MAHLRYVEALSGEDWKTINASFKGWLSSNAKLDRFGYTEDEALEVAGRKFVCFAFPEQYEPLLGLFESWASSSGRVHGHLKNGAVYFSGEPGLVIRVTRSNSEKEVPPWLRH